jgi:hypothetical protein
LNTGSPQTPSHLVAHKAAQDNVLTKLGDSLSDQILYSLVLVLDKGLSHQANLPVKLVQSSLNDAINNVLGLALFQNMSMVAGPLTLNHLLGHIFTSEITWRSKGDV